MNFDVCLHPWNHSYDQSNEHVHHSQSFPYVFINALSNLSSLHPHTLSPKQFVTYVGGVTDRKGWAVKYNWHVQEPRRCVLFYKMNKAYRKCTSEPAMKNEAPQASRKRSPSNAFVFGQRESSCPALWAHPWDFIWSDCEPHSEKLGKGITWEKIMVLWLQEDYWLSPPESVCPSGHGTPWPGWLAYSEILWSAT